MNEPGSEFSKPSERDLKIQQLIDQGAALLNEDKNGPQFEQQVLTYMSSLEEARSELGPFCVTVGEGDNRTIVFKGIQTDEKTSPLIFGINNQQYGSIVTRHEDRMVVNRLGVFKLVNEIDQYLTNETKVLPKVPPGDYDWQAWEDQNRPMAQGRGERNNRLLTAVLASGKYPEAPKYPIAGSGIQLTGEEHEALDRQSRLCEVGSILYPRWGVNGPLKPGRAITETAYATSTVDHFGAGDLRLISVDKPSPILSALKASIPPIEPSQKAA